MYPTQGIWFHKVAGDNGIARKEYYRTLLSGTLAFTHVAG
jgi:hypothetical protein